MTPVQIMGLLAIHTCGDMGQLTNYHSPAVQSALRYLEVMELIAHNQNASYQLTPRGECLVEALCALPMPVSVTRWEMPKESDV